MIVSHDRLSNLLFHSNRHLLFKHQMNTFIIEIDIFVIVRVCMAVDVVLQALKHRLEQLVN